MGKRYTHISNNIQRQNVGCNFCQNLLERKQQYIYPDVYAVCFQLSQTIEIVTSDGERNSDDMKCKSR